MKAFILASLAVFLTVGAHAQENKKRDLRLSPGLLIVDPLFQKSLSDGLNSRMEKSPDFAARYGTPLQQEVARNGILVPALKEESGGLKSSLGFRLRHGGGLIVYRAEFH